MRSWCWNGGKGRKSQAELGGSMVTVFSVLLEAVRTEHSVQVSIFTVICLCLLTRALFPRRTLRRTASCTPQHSLFNTFSSKGIAQKSWIRSLWPLSLLFYTWSLLTRGLRLAFWATFRQIKPQAVKKQHCLRTPTRRQRQRTLTPWIRTGCLSAGFNDLVTQTLCAFHFRLNPILWHRV